MTVDGLTWERVPDPAGGLPAPLGPAAILGICDGLLDEIGRRSHLFAWLRAPGAGHQDWLVVDSYYPGNRLVVICREPGGEHAAVYSELVPAHGLRLLALDPAQLPNDRSGAGEAITRLIEELGPAPRRPAVELDQPRPPREGPMARIAASLTQAAAAPVSRQTRLSPAQLAAAQRAARVAHNRKLASGRALRPRPEVRRAPARPAPARPGPARPAPARAGSVRPVQRALSPVPRPRTASHPAATVENRGPLLGLGLAAAGVLCVEVYLGIVQLGLLGGHLPLAFGIALDACSRGLGTIAAARAGKIYGAWWCALGGSPAVAGVLLLGRQGPISTDPAPVAGLLSLLAVVVLALALLTPAI